MTEKRHLYSGYEFNSPEVFRGITGRSELMVIGLGVLHMQVADPIVRIAVENHSQFPNDAVGRLYRTVDGFLGVALGTVEKAIHKAQRVQERHKPVTGVLDEQIGRYPAGTVYSARDPEHCLWVAATLAYGILEGYGEFVEQLAKVDKDQFLHESQTAFSMFNVPKGYMPTRWDDLLTYMDRMIADESLFIDENTTRMGDTIRTYPFPKWLQPSVLKKWNEYAELLTNRFLYPPLREPFGFTWGDYEQSQFAMISNKVRSFMQRPIVHPVRYAPQYHKANMKVFIGRVLQSLYGADV